MARVFNDRLKKLNLNLESIYLVAAFCCFAMFYYLFILDNKIVAEINGIIVIGLMICIGAIALLKLLQNKIKVQSLIFLILAFLVFIYSTNDRFVCIMLCGMSLCGVNKEEFIKVFYKYILLTFLLVIVLYSSGAMNYLYFSRDEIVRDSMGFRAATISNSVFLFIVITGVYSFRKDISLGYIVSSMVAATALYLLTNTRVSFLLTVLVLVAAVVLKYCNIKCNKFIKWIIISIPSCMLVLSFLLIWLYAVKFPYIDTINRVLSGRLSLAYSAFVNFGIEIFGQNIALMIGDSYVGVDMCWPYLLNSYGIVSLFCVQWCIIKLSQYALDKNDYYFILAILIITIGSFVEPYWINYQYNPFVLLIGLFFTKTPKNDCVVIKNKQVNNGCFIVKNR